MPCLSCRHGLDLGVIPFPEPGVGPSWPPSRSVSIERIDLGLDLYPAERRFVGRARVSLRPLASFAGRVSFDCDEIEILDVVDAEGAALPWRLEAGSLHVEAASCPAALEICWRGAEPRHGLYFVGPTPAHPDRPHSAWTQCQDEDAHFLLPCHDHPRVKHPWGVRLTGPAGSTLLSNGRLVQAGEADGRAFAVYEQAEPMPAYLFTAVCAPLEVVEDQWRGRPVRYLFPAGAGEAARRAMGRTPEMLELFSARTGVDYPWPRYDQVVVDDFVFGGMENVACTTMTDVLLVDEAVVDDWDPETLVAHELAHQWFGDLVTCIDWSHGWLNESWATFMEAVWYEHARSEADAIAYRHDLMRAYLEEANGRYARPIVDNRFREPIDVFDRHLYEKGACVLATLRAEIGEGPFWEGVRTYLERAAHGSAHTVDFRRALEDVTGHNLERFFDQWVLRRGHPVLKVKLSAQDGAVVVEVEQKQEGEGIPEAYALTLAVEIVGPGTRVVPLRVSARAQTFVIPVEGRPEHVRVDPGLRLLADIELAAPREWLARLAADPDPVLACRALAALLTEGSPPAIAAIGATLAEHPHRHVRAEAARLLGRRGDLVAEERLLSRLDAEPDAKVKRAVCDALESRRTPAVVEALRKLIHSEPAAPHLLGAALRALGRTRDPEALPLLREGLRRTSWADVIADRALEGLARTRVPEVFDDLLAATGAERPDRVRAAACRGLGDLGRHVPELAPRCREAIETQLVEGGFRTVLAAIQGLRALGEEDAIPALERARVAAGDGRVKRMAYEAIRALREKRAADGGLASLRDRVEKVAAEGRDLRSRVDRLDRPDA